MQKRHERLPAFAQGVTTTRSATTTGGGAYQDGGYVPNQSGTLTVTASWGGNSGYDGSSASCTVTLN